MAELADALDLESSSQEWGFKSPCPQYFLLKKPMSDIYTVRHRLFIVIIVAITNLTNIHSQYHINKYLLCKALFTAVSIILYRHPIYNRLTHIHKLLQYINTVKHHLPKMQTPLYYVSPPKPHRHFYLYFSFYFYPRFQNHTLCRKGKTYRNLPHSRTYKDLFQYFL